MTLLQSSRRWVLVVVVLTTITSCAARGAAQPPTLDAPAPDFALAQLTGDTVRLADQRGQVVIVNFWATWCGPCANETPRLVEWYNQYQSVGLTVWGVDTLYQDDRARVEAFAKQYQVTYPILTDEVGTVSRQWLAQQLPRSYVVDRAGVVRFVRIGELTERDLQNQVLPLLQP